MNVITLSKKDLDQAAETLYAAFMNDPLILWMFGDKENYLKNARWAFKTWIRWATLYGVAIATPHFEAIALRKKPGKHRFTLWNLWRSGMLATPARLGQTAMQRIEIFDRLSNAEQLKNIGSDQFWYCWMIGTHPDHQQQGFGKALMQHTFQLAKATQLPCYLETATAKNVEIHQKNGYQLLSSFDLPDSDVKIYCMRRT